MFICIVHACTYRCRRAKIIVYIGPSWATLIFFIISKFTLDPHEQHSFSSSSANSALFKSYNLIWKSACIFMCIALACMQISLPWYLLDNHFKLHKNLTSLRWNIMVCLLLQEACIFTCAVHACMQTIIINSGNQSWHMLKVLWRSDLIWLRYWGVLHKIANC